MKTQCPYCQAKLKAPDGATSKKLNCPKCNQSFVISPLTKDNIVEVCSTCGKEIGKFEQACVFSGKIVCAECDKKLRSSSEPDASDFKVIDKPVRSGDKELMHIKTEPVTSPTETIITTEGLEDKIKFECSRCGSIQISSESMIGYPEVCLNCKNATLVTDEKLYLELIRQRRSYEIHKIIAKALHGVFVCGFVAGFLCKKIPGPLSYFGNILFIIAGLSGIGSAIYGPSSRGVYKWVLKLDLDSEDARRIVCQTVLDLRAKGETVRLCDKCAGTRKGVFWGGKCRACSGRGYVED